MTMEAETGVTQTQDEGPPRIFWAHQKLGGGKAGFYGGSQRPGESQRPRPQKGERINLCCLSLPVCATLFQRPLRRPTHSSALQMQEQTCLSLHSLRLQSEPLGSLLPVEVCHLLPPRPLTCKQDGARE